MDFTELVDLAAEGVGGTVLYATDDFFASKDNLLKPKEAVFIDGKYTDNGKWMDGWESRRRREHAFASAPASDHDFAIVRLGLPGIVRGFVVDTAHFTGNYPAACSIEGASISGYPSLAELLSADVAWTEIAPRTDLRGGHKNRIEVDSAERYTHLRFHIYPDGGVARLRVHGEVVPDARWLGKRELPMLSDLAAAENGGVVVTCNDMFFGARHNLVGPGRAPHMGDGWETKRGRRPGPDWVVVRLAAEGQIVRAIIDTQHFKGNAPDACALCVATSRDGDPPGADDSLWTSLLPSTRLLPHTTHLFEDELLAHAPATHVRMRIWPDGGVSRLRLMGLPSARGREESGMRRVRAMPHAELEAALRSCCGSSAWVRKMVALRPLSDLASLQAAAAQTWDALAEADWDEAFRAHPRIGETKAAAAQSATAKAWSAGEQARVSEADPKVTAALAEANRAYEAKFGRIYIVCATGKTADEMLAIAEARLGNDAKTELAVAAGEQKKITALRLDKLVLR